MRHLEDQKPSLGRTVLYTLTDHDAQQINQRRADSADATTHGHARVGLKIHVGNGASPGQVYPMTIVRVWGDQPDSAVNGQVMLDGNDVHWATSVTMGDGPGHWSWPQRI